MKKKSNSSYVYLFYSEDLNLYKIGVSKNSKRRREQVQTGFPYKLSLLKEFKSDYPFKLEGSLHRRYKIYKENEDETKLHGEWFNLPIDIVDKFEDNCKEFEKNTNLLKEMGNPFV